MLRSAVFIFLALTRCIAAQNDTNLTTSSVQEAFSNAKIVPDVLPSFQPTALLNVTFTDQATGALLSVSPGMNLTMEQTMLEPTFAVTANSSDSLAEQIFVLAIVDPDAPTPQNTSISQFRHMLAGDLHVNASSGGALVNSSAALTDFVNPTPPAGSDPHRYVILLFTQPPTFNVTASTLVNASTPRTNFNLTAFGQAVGLGSPVAGNFFFTGPSDSTGTTSGSGSAPAPTTSDTGSSSSGASAVEKLVPVGGIWTVFMGAIAISYFL
ncbi:unnamed protein product [Somion occarium]|uniref:PEBP-like protein n=1 Tax=Somion occarium TaxID=3059160 RepID=A0ABP1D2I3_9APHY